MFQERLNILDNGIKIKDIACGYAHNLALDEKVMQIVERICAMWK